jgi:nitrite reductase/ring-hydroxylating ferredoxin subunit
LSEGWVEVAKAENVKAGEITGAKIGDVDIALYNIDGAFYATSNVCTHAIALLSNGFLDGDVVECPLHAGAFEVKTGKAVCAPAADDIKTYPTRVVGNALQIQIV